MRGASCVARPPEAPLTVIAAPATASSPRRRTSRLTAGLLAGLAAATLAGAVLYTPDVPAETLEARWADGASRFVTVAGQRVHVRDEGRGPPIVLLHGTSSSVHTWDAWAAALRDSFRVVRFDLPGFGLTGPSVADDYSVPAYVRFVEAVLDTLAVGPAIVAGNSLGGEIAWALAAEAPARVSRLVLLDPAGLPTGRGAPLPFFLAQLPLVGPVLSRITPRTIVARSLHEVYADEAKVTDTLIDRVWLMARRPGNREAFVHRARTPRANDGAGLARITAPTLVLFGAEDAWIPASLAPEFARRIAGATAVVLPGVGHLPQEEAPTASLDAVRRFLAASSVAATIAAPASAPARP